MRTCAALLLALLVTACNGDDAALPDGGTDGGADAGVDAPGGAGTVTVTTYAIHGDVGLVPEPVAWIAAQDGAGAFTRLTGAGNVYTFDVADPTGRYGVAIACANQPAGGDQVLQATLVEGTAIAMVCTPADTTGQHAFQLAIANTMPCNGLVSYPNTQHQINCLGPLGPSQALDGVHDIVGRASFGADRRVYIARDTSGPSHTVDFYDATRSRAAVVATVTAAPTSQIFVGFRTTTTYHSIYFGPGSTTWSGFPDDLREPLDVHQISVLEAAGMTHLLQRSPADVDVSSLPPLVAPTATVTRTTASWSPYLASGLSFRFGAWHLAVSAGWLDGATAYTYPPVCQAAGFPGTCPDADPAAGWTVTGYKPVLAFVAALPDVLAAEAAPVLASAGLSYSAATASGTF